MKKNQIGVFEGDMVEGESIKEVLEIEEEET